MDDIVVITITLIIGTIMFAGIVVAAILVYRYEKEYHPKLDYKDIPEPSVEYFNAKVLTKRMNYYIDPKAIHLPRSVLEFLVTFELENGTKHEFSLTKEMFDKLEEGQESTLVLMNGMFFDFGEGEEINNEKNF